jgi:hypothetical protein
MMGEYQLTTKKLEITLEKTRMEMVKVMKGVSVARPGKGSEPSKLVGRANSMVVSPKTKDESMIIGKTFKCVPVVKTDEKQMYKKNKEEIEALYLPLAEDNVLNWSPLAPKNIENPVEPGVKRISTSPLMMSMRRKLSATPGVYKSADY